jgi:hypothetical protein
MSQKERTPEFKGKYFVSVTGKFRFVVLSGNTGLLLPQQVGGLTQFLGIRCFLVNCFCNKHHAVFSSAVCVYCWKLFSNAVMCKAVKQVYQAHFRDAAAVTITLKKQWRGVSMNVLKPVDLCLQKGGGEFQRVL